jgi:hypothetical protein
MHEILLKKRTRFPGKSYDLETIEAERKNSRLFLKECSLLVA